VIDANIEGLRHLLNRHSGCPSIPSAREEPWENLSDTWTRRAKRHLEDHLQTIRCRQGYDSIDRYKGLSGTLTGFWKNQFLPPASASAFVIMRTRTFLLSAALI